MLWKGPSAALKANAIMQGRRKDGSEGHSLQFENVQEHKSMETPLTAHNID